MGWRIEKWLADIFPSNDVILEDYKKLSTRELIIIGAASFDTALAELISKRLTGSESEITEFLGADEDGRAPAGSFGARIQLARLLGIISDADMEVFRALKRLRNVMAHRVNVNVLSPKCQIPLKSLYDVWMRFVKNIDKTKGGLTELEVVGANLTSDPEASHALILGVIWSFHTYFAVLHKYVKRLNELPPLIPPQTAGTSG